MLLAFAVVVVWEKFNQAESEVAKEAGATATVFRLTRGILTEHGASIRKATTDYLTSAIASDWPAMASGTASPATTELLNEIYHAVLKFHSFGTDEGLVLAEILRATAHSQEIKGECFQVVSPVAGTSPASFLLLNKCSGATWMLVRVLELEGKPGKADYFTYKWLPLSTESESHRLCACHSTVTG